MKKGQLKVRNNYNSLSLSQGKEKGNIQTETVQGSGYTIRELLEKYTSGIMPPIGQEPYYQGDEDTINIDGQALISHGIDLTDVDEIKKLITQLEQDLKEQTSKNSQGESAPGNGVKPEGKTELAESNPKDAPEPQAPKP